MHRKKTDLGWEHDEQPVIKLIKHRKVGNLENLFFFGDHFGIEKKRRGYIATCIIEFIENKLWSRS